MLDYEISTFGCRNVHVFSETLFQLFFNIVIFQKWNMRIVKLNNIFAFRSDYFDVSFHILYHFFVIANDADKILVKVVPKNRRCFVFLTQDLTRNFVFLNILESCFPLFHQLIHIIMKFSYLFPEKGKTKKYAMI